MLDPAFADFLGPTLAARFDKLDAQTRLAKHHEWKSGRIRNPDATKLEELATRYGSVDAAKKEGSPEERLAVDLIEKANGTKKPVVAEALILPDSPAICALPATDRLRLHQSLTAWTEAGRVIADCQAEAVRHPGTGSTAGMVTDRVRRVSAARARRAEIQRTNPLLNLPSDE